ncbi:MAG: hypothetical protein WBG86_02155 [Polyangiales bacterium]
MSSRTGCLRWFLISFVAIVATVGVAGAFLAGTDKGRSILAGWVEDFTNTKIPGSMKIGTLETLGWGQPVARNVEFFTPDGASVIRVDRGEVDLSFSDLFLGRVGFDKARADGGTFVIEVKKGGGTNVEDAFSSPDGNAKLELHNMHVEGMKVLLKMDGSTRFALRDVQGFLSVWRRDTPGARVSINRVEGEFEKPQILGNTIKLTRMDGEVWAQEEHVVRMKLDTKIGTGGIIADLNYFDRPKEPATLELSPDAAGGSIIASVATEVISWFSGKLDVKFDPSE